MKSFKEVWQQAVEDMTTSAVAMPADAVHDKKKKKKNEGMSLSFDPTKKRKERRKSQYDGRTKEGKRFVERMLAKRKAREAKKLEN